MQCCVLNANGTKNATLSIWIDCGSGLRRTVWKIDESPVSTLHILSKVLRHPWRIVCISWICHMGNFDW